MANPEAYALALLDYAGITISKLVRDHVSSDKKILDIGAGWGKYRFLLPEYEMDALDIWQPYVEQHKLNAYYDKVFVTDAATFKYPQSYGAIIMGDVLEHIPVKDAQKVIRDVCNNSDFVFISTPFEMEQGPVDGNDHESHVQPDLTEAVMAERYPELELFDTFGRPGEHVKSIYVKKGSLL